LTRISSHIERSVTTITSDRQSITLGMVGVGGVDLVMAATPSLILDIASLSIFPPVVSGVNDIALSITANANVSASILAVANIHADISSSATLAGNLIAGFDISAGMTPDSILVASGVAIVSDRVGMVTSAKFVANIVSTTRMASNMTASGALSAPLSAKANTSAGITTNAILSGDLTDAAGAVTVTNMAASNQVGATLTADAAATFNASTAMAATAGPTFSLSATANTLSPMSAGGALSGTLVDAASAGGSAAAWLSGADSYGLSTMFEQSGGTVPVTLNSPIGRATNQIGTNHLIQATAAARPTIGGTTSAYQTKFDLSNSLSASVYTQVSKASDFTVEAIVLINTLTTDRGNVVFDNTNSSADRVGVNVRNGRVNFGIYNGSTWSEVSSNAALTIGQYYRVSAVNEAGVLKLYIDGVAQSATTGDRYAFSNGKFLIGRNENDAGSFDGQISDVRIWNAARTQAAITADKAQRLAGTETNLIAYWPM